MSPARSFTYRLAALQWLFAWAVVLGAVMARFAPGISSSRPTWYSCLHLSTSTFASARVQKISPFSSSSQCFP